MNYSGNNIRGRIRIDEHAHPLVRRLITEMNDQRVTFRDISRRSGVGVDTLRFWQTRHIPRLDLFEAALNTLGYKLCVVEKGDNQ